MNRPIEKSSVVWLLFWLVAGAVGVGAGLETSRYSHYVFAAACLFLGLSAYRRPPIRIFADERPASRAPQADVTSIIGMVLLAASLVLRYVVPAG